MRKLCLLISFFIIFLDGTSLNQLIKAPFLVIHYREHHQIDHRVGFFDFLGMHYWGTDLNDNDNDRDMELPFKKGSDHSIYQIYLPIQKPSVEYQQQFVWISFNAVMQDQHLSDPSLSELFRPPRA